VKILIISTIVLLAISAIVDLSKTKKALGIAAKKLKKILPAFLDMLILVSLALYFVPPELILKYLGNSNQILAPIMAMLVGTIAFMPGFIAFPLSGILLEQGVSYTIIAIFTTSLMMVGIVTFPIEKEFLGVKVALIRNLLGLIMAVIVSIVIGLSYGEISL
jgi:uncharacterized membrane protein YraQ (UPF0718 family)